MGKQIALPELPSDDGLMLFDLGLSRNELDQFWRLVLAMAVREGASSVHYHPWRAEGQLSMIVAGLPYEMVPPPREVAPRVAAAAGMILGGRTLGATIRRWFGWPTRTAGHVRLSNAEGESDWAGVVWSAGPIVGVEWYRLDTVPTRTGDPCENRVC